MNQNSGVRSQKSIWSGSPIGLDCARVGNKQLGDLFEGASISAVAAYPESGTELLEHVKTV